MVPACNVNPSSTPAVGHGQDHLPQDVGRHHRIFARRARRRLRRLSRVQRLGDRLAAVNEAVPRCPRRSQRHRHDPQWACDLRELDYVPVFELAADLLDVLADGPAQLQQAAIAPLAEAMVVAAHDLSGCLFRVGAKFSRRPTPRCRRRRCTRLVFHEWPEPDEGPTSASLRSRRFGLLIRKLRRPRSEVERRHLDAGGTNATALHKAMVEQALHGYDVQLSAIISPRPASPCSTPTSSCRLNLYVLPRQPSISSARRSHRVRRVPGPRRISYRAHSVKASTAPASTPKPLPALWQSSVRHRA